jgi:hypothetical protein
MAFSTLHSKEKGGHHREHGSEHGEEVVTEGVDDAGHGGLLVRFGLKVVAVVSLLLVVGACACRLVVAGVFRVERQCRSQSAGFSPPVGCAGCCWIQVMSACGARPERHANYSRVSLG